MQANSSIYKISKDSNSKKKKTLPKSSYFFSDAPFFLASELVNVWEGGFSFSIFSLEGEGFFFLHLILSFINTINADNVKFSRKYTNH